jgi:hypothetical protein
MLMFEPISLFSFFFLIFSLILDFMLFLLIDLEFWFFFIKYIQLLANIKSCKLLTILENKIQ